MPKDTGFKIRKKRMALINCPECITQISDKALSCPRCGNPMKPGADPARLILRGYEWRSKTQIMGWPLVHIAAGRNKETGKLMVAKGIIAIGQFGIGVITIAQFGIGVLFGLGQFMVGIISVAQFAIGMTVIAQFGVGQHVLAQIGYGRYVWSTKMKDPVAMEYFKSLWSSITGFF